MRSADNAKDGHSLGNMHERKTAVIHFLGKKSADNDCLSEEAPCGNVFTSAGT